MEKQLTNRFKNFEEKLKYLENMPPQTFLDIYDQTYDFENLRYIHNFLYHGIRFQNHLEKLESIFKDRAILAGNYQNQHSHYYDNCNEGEYISLLSTDGHYNLEYETFILPNITLVISPNCNPIKTIYLPYHEWIQIKGKKTKNRYSYANNEYQIKQKIPLTMIKAIGIPVRYLRSINKDELIDIYIQDILELMNKYNIYLPLVDTSAYNAPIITKNTNILQKKKK